MTLIIDHAREALQHTSVNTQTPQCTHTHTHAHKQRWVISGQAFTVHSQRRGGQRGVSWIIDELERGSRQICGTRLTPRLSVCPGAWFSFFSMTVWLCWRNRERNCQSEETLSANTSERENDRVRGGKVEQNVTLIYLFTWACVKLG